MKETRYFYDPQLSGSLPEEEARHVVRVLRMSEGDEINIMDGNGTFHRAVITAAANHRCLYRVMESKPQERLWNGHIHLAVAPTKLNERMEWLAEKATEIGWDEVTFLDCQFSERSTIKIERIGKIVVSAVKQSHKAWIPRVNDMTSFKEFVLAQEKKVGQQNFICHCYEGDKPFLMEQVGQSGDALVMIGPEGDFSIAEVDFAREHGFVAVSLGNSRLRTETAALAAVHMMQIVKYIRL